jgi:hypothetical protein
MVDIAYNVCDDGLGAQYLRIIGIITLAKKFNLKYVHNKIKKMIFISDDNHSDENYLNEIEDYLQISSNFEAVDFNKYDEIICCDVFSEHVLNIIINNNKNKKVLLLVKIAHVFIENHDIGLYDLTLPFLRSIKKKRELIYFKEDAFNVAIHIRRGDVNLKEYPERYVSTENIKKIYDFLNKKYTNTNFCIFTEIDENNEREFDIFKNLDINILSKTDELVTFEHMVNANALVICKSTFSYVPGMYNQNDVYNINFWHKSLKNWKTIV